MKYISEKHTKIKDTTPRYIFCDVDGTIINFKSMFSFLEFFKKNIDFNKDIDRDSFINNCRKFDSVLKSSAHREEVNRAYYRQFSGIHDSMFFDLIKKWSEIQKINIKSLLINPVVKEINELRLSLNANVCFVSGSFIGLIKPFMEELDVQECLSTNLVIDGRKISGEITSPQTIGEGKAKSILSFLYGKNIDPDDCVAYGDHYSDIPMLECVGKAVAVIGHEELRLEAIKRSWRTIDV